MKFSILLLSASAVISFFARLGGVSIFPALSPAGFALATLLFIFWGAAGLLLAMSSLEIKSQRRVEKEFLWYLAIILLLLAIDVVFFRS